MSESLNDVVSRIVQQHGLANERAIDKAIQRQRKLRKKSGRKEPLERILVDLGIIKPKHLKGLRYAVLYYLVRKADRFYGKIAVQSELCRQKDVDRALTEQKTLHQKQKRLVRINKILLEAGKLSKAEDKAIQRAIDNLRNKGGNAPADVEKSMLRFKDSDDDARDVLDNELSDDLELEGVDEDEIDDLEEVSSDDLDVPDVDDIDDIDDDDFDDDFDDDNSDDAEDLLADLSSEDDLDLADSAEDELESGEEFDDDLEDDESFDGEESFVDEESEIDDYEEGLDSDSEDISSYEAGLDADSDMDLDEFDDEEEDFDDLDDDDDFEDEGRRGRSCSRTAS